MNLWIDCEWNSFGGELISIALVDEEGKFFYESLGCKNPDPWVAKNVMPVINRATSCKEKLQKDLKDFLNAYPSVHIIADWPEDIASFCNLLIIGAGKRLNTPALTMEVVRININSKIPHNALADALALKNEYLGLYANI